MSEWTAGDKMTVALMNQKTLYVGSGAPTTKYDGQLWASVSSNPPLLKSYDATNSGWMQYGETRYETVLSGQLPASGVYLNGALCVAYDTQQSSAKMFAYANGSWRNMGGTLARTYPYGAAQDTGTVGGDTNSVDWGKTEAKLASGASATLAIAYVKPDTSGDYVVAYAGGTGLENTGGDVRIRLIIGSVQVGEQALMDTKTYITLISGAQVSNASCSISLKYYSARSGGSITHTGLSVGGVVVTT
jgi:hypothetical protein